MDLQQNRVTYQDNIRNILVYLVVFFHIICMFTYSLTFWWPIIDKDGSSNVYKNFIVLFDIFLMPSLLFIAALFIFYSLKTKTALEYIKKRFFRLFVPLLVFVFCAADVFYQIRLNRLDGSNVAYLTTFLDFWRDYIKFGVITFSQEGYMLNQTGFSTLHAWFLSFLFPLTVVTVLLTLPFRKKEKVQREVDSRKKIISKTIILAILLGLLYAIVAIFCAVRNIRFDSWLLVFGFIEVRLNQFFILLPMFLFGLYMYRKDWLSRGDIGNWKMWGIVSAVLIFVFVIIFSNRVLSLLEEIMKAAEHNMTLSDKIPFPLITDSFKMASLITTFVQPPICIFVIMFILSFTNKFFNRPNIITTFCSKHSINVYVLHYVPVLVLQSLFVNIPIAPILKIILMIIIVIPACLWLSHRLVYPHPVIAIAFFVLLKAVALAAGFDFYYIAILSVTFISFAGAVFEFVRFQKAKLNKSQ
jgi:glucans biosynthesis protein C